MLVWLHVYMHCMQVRRNTIELSKLKLKACVRVRVRVSVRAMAAE